MCSLSFCLTPAKKGINILTDFLFFFQAFTTNAFMPPVTEAGCLASRRIVNTAIVIPASSSPLKLTVPTK